MQKSRSASRDPTISTVRDSKQSASAREPDNRCVGMNDGEIWKHEL